MGIFMRLNNNDADRDLWDLRIKMAKDILDIISSILFSMGLLGCVILICAALYRMGGK
jgi:hypothetical protein